MPRPPPRPPLPPKPPRPPEVPAEERVNEAESRNDFPRTEGHFCCCLIFLLGWECVGNDRRSPVREAGPKIFAVCTQLYSSHPRITQKRGTPPFLFSTTYNHVCTVRPSDSSPHAPNIDSDTTENLFKISRTAKLSPTGIKLSISSSFTPFARPRTH